MPNYWFFLTDPEDYHLDELFAKKTEVWDGVLGSVAQKYLGEIRKGDRIIGYHTAPDKSAYAVLEATSEPYQNPELKQKNLVVKQGGVFMFNRPGQRGDRKSPAHLEQLHLFEMFRPIAVSPLTSAEY